ncbi:hypothetical protein ONS96_014941 [Cadophora gregata f. sp. sojae]|nr:hypothetical protein ONS96_014941 [Cadophora gregata f. sp. sojae]
MYDTAGKFGLPYHGNPGFALLTMVGYVAGRLFLDSPCFFGFQYLFACLLAWFMFWFPSHSIDLSSVSRSTWMRDGNKPTCVYEIMEGLRLENLCCLRWQEVRKIFIWTGWDWIWDE